jgi:hypothetical protein
MTNQPNLGTSRTPQMTSISPPFATFQWSLAPCSACALSQRQLLWGTQPAGVRYIQLSHESIYAYMTWFSHQEPYMYIMCKYIYTKTIWIYIYIYKNSLIVVGSWNMYLVEPAHELCGSSLSLFHVFSTILTRQFPAIGVVQLRHANRLVYSGLPTSSPMFSSLLSAGGAFAAHRPPKPWHTGSYGDAIGVI